MVSGKEHQVRSGGAGEAGAHADAIGAYPLGRAVADGQSAPDAVVLVVDVDEHVFPGRVAVKTIPRQAADLVRPTPGIDEKLGDYPDFDAKALFQAEVPPGVVTGWGVELGFCAVVGRLY